MFALSFMFGWCDLLHQGLNEHMIHLTFSQYSLMIYATIDVTKIQILVHGQDYHVFQR
jgi:hypothetical protein